MQKDEDTKADQGKIKHRKQRMTHFHGDSHSLCLRVVSQREGEVKKGKELKVAMSRIKGREKDKNVNSSIVICLGMGCQIKR